MSDQPWGVGEDAPLNEGSEDTAVGTGNIADRRAAEDETAQDATRTGGGNDEPPYDPDEEHRQQAGVQGGQPNLTPDPAVSGRRSYFGQGSTDDSPGNAV
jgi:general stress protein YciG